MKKYLPFLLPLLWVGCTHRIKPAESPSRQPIIYDTTINGRVYIGPGMASPDQKLYVEPQLYAPGGTTSPNIIILPATPVPQSFITAPTVPQSFITAPTVLKYHISGDIVLTPYGVVPPVDTIVTPPVDTIVTVPPTSDFFVGVNTHPWIDPANTDPIGWLRYYLSSYYFWVGPGGKIKPQPMLQGGTPTAWGLDDILQKAKGKYKVLFTVHQTPTWLVNEGRTDGGGDNLPVPVGASRTDTNSYREYALMLEQLTMRYGRVPYPDSRLNVDLTARWTGDENVKKSGMNLLTYFQFWNEEKWWKPEGKENVAPEEMAAMMSMGYDHIKRIDPSMQVVMPCISDLYMPYVQRMDAWFVKYRKDKKWPCDIAAFNHYGNAGNKLGQYPAQWVMSGGVEASKDANFPTINTIVAFFKVRNIPVWITEMGFDTREPSPMFIVGGELAQGTAIVNTAESYRKAGVKGVFIFTTANEPNPSGGGLYMNAGILNEQSKQYSKKAGFQTIATYVRGIQAIPSVQMFPVNLSRDKPLTVPPLQRPKKK